MPDIACGVRLIKPGVGQRTNSSADGTASSPSLSHFISSFIHLYAALLQKTTVLTLSLPQTQSFVIMILTSTIPSIHFCLFSGAAALSQDQISDASVWCGSILQTPQLSESLTSHLLLADECP